ncbi:MAG TPA: hypothetical protein VFC44_00190 [Candidatus Saccharimonadales bacterium]|nr:hypothetical protein [Candidatus Saccharimonadales bacterium]
MSLFKEDPIGVEIQGRKLKCLVCSHDAFWKKVAQLNTAGRRSTVPKVKSRP